MENVQDKIIEQLYYTVQLLGGGSDILSTIGSCGKEQPYEDTLQMIKEYNEAIIEKRKST